MHDLMDLFDETDGYVRRRLAEKKIRKRVVQDRKACDRAVQRLAQAEADRQREAVPCDRPARVGFVPPIDPLARPRKRWALT